jgi:hypothetical protein
MNTQPNNNNFTLCTNTDEGKPTVFSDYQIDLCGVQAPIESFRMNLNINK